jgi:hypothetical protein
MTIIRKTKIVYSKNRQTGKSNNIIDALLPAMLPGKRISKYQGTYYEYRKNRSDKNKLKI